MPIQLCAYLSYNGDCTDAMTFYAQVLGAKLEALITYGQVPGEIPVPPEHAERVMHAYLVHKDFAIMYGDAPPGVPLGETFRADTFGMVTDRVGTP